MVWELVHNPVVKNLAFSIPVTFASGLTADSVAQGFVIRNAKKANEQKKKRGERGGDSVPEVPDFNFRRAIVFGSTGAILTGPASMLRLNLYDWLLPGNRLLVEVPIKSAIEVFVFTPLLTALGMGINEYMKPAGSMAKVGTRLKSELWKVYSASVVTKLTINLLRMGFPTPALKFLVGTVMNLLLNIYTSIRINANIASVEDAKDAPDPASATDSKSDNDDKAEQIAAESNIDTENEEKA